MLGRSREPEAPIRRPQSAAWYAANAPIVEEYLTTLSDSQIGTPLGGIPLSDGKRWFEGDIYLGRPENLPDAVHIVLLRRSEQVVAYLWIDEGGEPFPLEACGKKGASIRARRLGGTVHAWRALRPEHGIVYTECPPAEWLP
jgi:hypothetical protein